MNVGFTVEWRNEKGNTFSVVAASPKAAMKIALSKLSVGYPHVFIRLREVEAASVAGEVGQGGYRPSHGEKGEPDQGREGLKSSL